MSTGYFNRTCPNRLPIEKIIVGKRLRRDLGDIGALAASIADVGLLHPVVVHPNGQLIAGLRRLKAVQQLGWEEVPVTMVRELRELERALKAEQDENTCRKDLLPTEMVAQVKEALKVEEPAARERQREGKRKGGKIAGRGRPKSKETSNGAEKKSRSTAKSRAAGAVGVSQPTYEKAKHVMDKAEEEPEKYGPIVEEMDRTGKVDGAFKKAKLLEEKGRSEPTMADEVEQAFIVFRKRLATLLIEVNSWEEFAAGLAKAERFKLHDDVIQPVGSEIVDLMNALRTP